MEISVGNLPLQGTKLFVTIAFSLCSLLLIILQPVTPQALQPKPIHIVNACFPLQLALQNTLSKLNATLGKYPKFSSKENIGKKIAIGGNITATTHVTVLYTPSHIKEII